jgi:hypothetical protein
VQDAGWRGNGPHEAIEQKIVDLLNLAGKDERTIPVMGVTDEAKARRWCCSQR